MEYYDIDLFADDATCTFHANGKTKYEVEICSSESAKAFLSRIHITID